MSEKDCVKNSHRQSHSWPSLKPPLAVHCFTMTQFPHSLFFFILSDDMIKSRRKAATSRRALARKPTAADKAAGRQRATRTAKINARRGIQQTSPGKPSAMEIEREVYRQTRMNNQPKQEKTKTGPRSQRDSAAQVKARKQLKSDKKKKAQQQKGTTNNLPPTWVAGTRRPPSKKAVSAAVNAMTNAGFKVPQGMQMVISFAPAPDKPPKSSGTANAQKGNQNNHNKGNAGNSNKGKQNKNKGGGHKK